MFWVLSVTETPHPRDRAATDTPPAGSAPATAPTNPAGPTFGEVWAVLERLQVPTFRLRDASQLDAMDQLAELLAATTCQGRPFAVESYIELEEADDRKEPDSPG